MTLISQAIVVVCAAILVELPREAVPRPLVPALPDPPPVGGAGRARSDHVAVDLRLALQRRELVPRSTRRSASCGLHLAFHRRVHVAEHAAVARPGPNLAMASIITVQAWRVLPVRRRDLPRRPRVDPAGGRGRREGRRRDGDQEADLRHAAAAAADRARGGPLRDRLHRDRHGGRLHPHERRAVQLDAGDHDVGVPDRGSRAARSARARRCRSSCCRCSRVVAITMLFFARRAEVA